MVNSSRKPNLDHFTVHPLCRSNRSDFLVVYFRTQLDIVISARKLLACGVQRDRVALHVAADEE
ncbi:hypothetical protein [Dyella acidiphila]|uniref:Uncharacterized protein n=1 Tax=Dyella acidiphila TaxID=2775866 RepID=A0ABR9GBU3_9GAMM|nr:hypothetical protein [Dyella acidiphila]MBE1161512.1 hypothetical protein [Dyella acidiphila]